MLLNQLGFKFEQRHPDIDETPSASEHPSSYVLRLAQEKAAVGLKTTKTPTVFLAADTIVVKGDVIYEKPQDEADYMNMLSALSGSQHQVLTAVALMDGQHVSAKLMETTIQFCEITPQQMNQYWLTGEPKDKAGGYAIQGGGGNFIRTIKGSYSAAVGLPLVETRELLSAFGVHPQ